MDSTQDAGLRRKPSYRPHGRLLAVGVPIVLLIVGLSWHLIAARTSGGADFRGPLSAALADGSSQSGTWGLTPGDAASVGIWPPDNRGSSTAVLESVHLIGVIPGTRVLGIRVTPCGLRSDQGFPPEHVCDRAPLDPVAGYLDRPGPPPSGVRIVVGISAPRRGTFGFAGVSLTYRVGTRQYRAIYVQGGSSAAEETAGAARSTVRSSRSSISWRTAGSTRPKR